MLLLELSCKLLFSTVLALSTLVELSGEFVKEELIASAAPIKLEGPNRTVRVTAPVVSHFFPDFHVLNP